METIVDELRRNRESGARRLEGEYRAGLMTLARRFCADEGDAEELVNRTFAAVVEGIDGYVEQSAFFGWMCQILSNLHAADVRRKSNRSESADPDAIAGAADADATERLFRDVDASLLRDAVETLPANMRETILLHYFLDMPVAKIARFLAIPSGTVLSRLHYARLALAGKLGAATRRPGARLVLLALLLAAGLAAGRALYTLGTAVLETHAESAESVSHAVFAESVEVVSHAESAESAALVSHAEDAESAALVSRAEDAESAALVSHAESAEPVSDVSAVPFNPSTSSTPDPSAMKTRSLLAATAFLSLSAAPASAAWTVTTTGAPSGCTHVISDGNWQIGVFRYSDDNWSLGKQIGNNGSPYIAGSGDLDLTGLEADCGVVLKRSNNGALEKNNNIYSVRFPDSLESTDGNTFKECRNLTNMVFGTGFKTVGGEMFRSCSALKTVTFPPGLETIGYYGFNGCSALVLDNFTFPATVTTMGDHAFTGCTKITGTLTFPGLTTMSGTYQFEDCKGMTGFSAPSLCTIPQGMFNRCTALASASFSPDLSSIGTDAFNNSGALVSFYPTTMPKLTSFGNNGLRGHKKLVADFDLSQSPLASLGSMAFVDGEKIGTIKLPETLATLGNYSLAFNNASRVVWFCGPPPTSIGSNALEPKNSKKWVLVAGVKHAAEWKADEHLIALADGESATALAAAKALGLSGVRPIGKWTYQANASTHWVVEELPPATLILVK